MRPEKFALVLLLRACAHAAADAEGAAPAPPAALALRAGTVNTAARAAPLGPEPGAIPRGKRVVLQLDGPITPARRARLAAAGVRLGDYIPACAYVADLSAADARALGAIDFIRWWSPFQPAWKL